MTLLVITDPPGMVPIFLALTGPLPARDRNRAAWQAVALALGVIVVFAVAGQTLLDYLHVDLPALQAAGGLLLVLVALELLTGKADDPSQQVTSNIALVPLGTPLLAGPGAIVATMLFVQRADGLGDFTAIAVAILAVMVAVWLVLRFSGGIVKILRPGGIEVLTRIAGLLLAAIAVQLIADAVAAFVTQYVQHGLTGTRAMSGVGWQDRRRASDPRSAVAAGRRRPGPPAARRRRRAARLRGHAGAAVRLHAEQARRVRGLPAPLPLLLRRPARAAEGPAVGAQLARRQRAHGPEELVCAARRPAASRGAGHAAQGHLGPRGLPRRRAGAGRLPAGAGLAGGLRRRRWSRTTTRSAWSGWWRSRPPCWRSTAGPTGSTRGPARTGRSWSSSTTRPAAPGWTPTTPGARRRWRSTRTPPSGCSAGRAAGWSCTTCRPARSPPTTTPSSRWPGSCPARRRRPATSWPPSGRSPTAPTRTRRSRWRPARAVAGATSGGTARPARRRPGKEPWAAVDRPADG